MLGAQHAAADLQDLAVERLGLRVLSLYLVNVGQTAHGSQGVGMLRTQHAALDLQSSG